MLEMFKCTKCLETKELKEFGPVKNIKSGHSSACRDCVNKYYRKRHKEKGRKRYPNTCIVCNTKFNSARRLSNYCSNKCIAHREHNGNYKGGKRVQSNGYVLIYSPDHPYKSKTNTILEHRLVMEKKIGRYLKPEEVVHHRNCIRDDNRIDNLYLFKNSAEHTKHHFQKRRFLC